MRSFLDLQTLPALPVALCALLTGCTTGTVTTTEDDGRDPTAGARCIFELSVDTERVTAKVANVDDGVVTACYGDSCEQAIVNEGTTPPPGSSATYALEFHAKGDGDPAWRGSISVDPGRTQQDPVDVSLSLTRRVTQDEAAAGVPVHVTLESAGYVSIDHQGKSAYALSVLTNPSCR